jgi:glycosyltransferase involved in cell wall biosynthesis
LVDAPVQSLFDYYTEFSNLTLQNRIEASILTKKAFRRSDLIIASSDWCKQESVRHCRILPDKIEVVEFGANIDDVDIPKLAKRYDQSKPLNIYWSGVNWARKGGDVAFECCRELVARGFDVRFNITGMKQLPDEISSQSWVINHGFLNKNNSSEYHRLIDIMSQQDIFLFPSRAECSSIALCEANGFSLPCFVYDTGGTANYVKNGYNGYMLPLTATGSDFADIIVNSYSRFAELSANARRKYETTLNWKAWSDRVGEFFKRNLLV